MTEGWEHAQHGLTGERDGSHPRHTEPDGWRSQGRSV